MFHIPNGARANALPTKLLTRAENTTMIELIHQGMVACTHEDLID